MTVKAEIVGHLSREKGKFPHFNSSLLNSLWHVHLFHVVLHINFFSLSSGGKVLDEYSRMLIMSEILLTI